MTNKFSKKEAISFGWKVMKENFWFFFGLLIVMGLVNFFPEIAKALLKEKTFITIANFIAFALGLILQLGFIKICLKFYDNQKPKFSEFFLQYPLFFKMFFGYILYLLIVIAGLILFIIPGIIFAIKFFFYKYFIVDEGLGPIEALKRSWRIAKGSGWNLFAFILLISAVNLLGVLAFVVGLLLTLPTTALATVFVYRKLLAQSESTSE
jgi:uncharacterized membrane protein